jgi:hypothetical protein
MSKEELTEIVNYFAQSKEVQMYMKYVRLLNEANAKEKPPIEVE